MIDKFVNEALEAAYSGNWKKAIKLNKQILIENSKDLKALNRLAKAYMELNKPQKAIKVYEQVLKIDSYNMIAQKNLKRIKNFNKIDRSLKQSSCMPVTFIEEPGKTKTVRLINTGEPSVLVNVNAGDQVNLSARKRFICVNTAGDNKHLGKIPEDLSLRLISLIAGGNKYEAWIKSIKDQDVRVFIKEVHRSSSFVSIPSFPDSEHSSYLAFTDPAVVYTDRPDTTTTEEQE